MFYFNLQVVLDFNFHKTSLLVFSFKDFGKKKVRSVSFLGDKEKFLLNL